MSEAFTCNSCQKRVRPEFQIIDAGLSIPLTTTPAIKRCPDCGQVLSTP